MPKEEVCCLCREPGFVAQRTDDGPVCRKCYGLKQYYNPWKHEFCIECGKHKAVARRTTQGEPVCPACVRKIPEFFEQCFYCEEERSVKRRNTFDKAICPECVAAGRGPRPKTGTRTLRIPGITHKKLEFRRRQAA